MKLLNKNTIAKYHTAILSGRACTYSPESSEHKEIKNYIDACFANQVGDTQSFLTIKGELKRNNSANGHVFLRCKELWQTEGIKAARKFLLQANVNQQIPIWNIEYNIYLGFISLNLGEYDKAITLLEKAKLLSLRHEFFERAARCSANLYICYREKKDNYKENKELIFLKEVCNEHELDFITPIYLYNDAFYQFEKANYEESLRLIKQALHLFKNEHTDDFIAFSTLQVHLYTRKGEIELAKKTLNNMSETFRIRGLSKWDHFIIILKAQLYIEEKKIIEASRLLNHIKEFETLPETTKYSYLITKIKLSILGDGYSLTQPEIAWIENECKNEARAEDDIRANYLIYRLKYHTENLNEEFHLLKLEYEKTNQPFNLLTLRNFRLFYHALAKDLQKVNTHLKDLITTYATYDMQGKILQTQEIVSCLNSNESLGKLLWPFNKMSQESNVIIDLNNKEFILNGIDHIPIPSGILSTFIKLLISNNSSVSMEIICQHLWQEEYNPIIHNNRIYNLVLRIRNFFDKNNIPKEILETSNYSYKLRAKLVSEINNSKESKIIRFLNRYGQNDEIDLNQLTDFLQQSRRQTLRDISRLISDKQIIVKGSKTRKRYYKA